MEEFEIDLVVGEPVQIGDYVITIIDTDEEGVEIEVENEGECEQFTLKRCPEVLSEMV